jgi:hypothetical protein
VRLALSQQPDVLGFRILDDGSDPNSSTNWQNRGVRFALVFHFRQGATVVHDELIEFNLFRTTGGLRLVCLADNSSVEVATRGRVDVQQWGSATHILDTPLRLAAVKLKDKRGWAF